MNETYSELMGSARPARSAVEVARLPKDVKVGLEMIYSMTVSFTYTTIWIYSIRSFHEFRWPFLSVSTQVSHIFFFRLKSSALLLSQNREKVSFYMKLKQLEQELQTVPPFLEPKIQFEQYPTTAHLCAHMLFTAHGFYDLEEKIVLDLGMFLLSLEPDYLDLQLISATQHISYCPAYL